MKCSERDFNSNIFSLMIFIWSSKILSCFWLDVYSLFFTNVYIHNVVSTLSNNVKIDVEDDNVVPMLPNVVQINAKIDNVNLTLFNVVNFNVVVYNVVSTLIWLCMTSRRHINLKPKLKQRWNICWVIKDHTPASHWSCFWFLFLLLSILNILFFLLGAKPQNNFV